MITDLRRLFNYQSCQCTAIAKSSQDQIKGLIKVTTKITAGLRNKVKVTLADQTDNQIIDGSKKVIGTP